jgi:hypothetical protein
MQQKNLCLASTATLLACRSIAQAFAENIFELAHLRISWDVEYAESLKSRVAEILEGHLAEGKNQIQPDKVNAWRELMISALTDLAIIRACAKVDFKEDKDFLKEFFAKTGYTAYFSDAKNGDHISMFNFLKTFAENISEEWITKITAGGLDKNVVTRLIEDARSLDNFRECFDVVTDTSLVDDTGRRKLEKVYAEIQDICRVSTAYYYFDPVKRESFNFFKALRNIQQ